MQTKFSLSRKWDRLFFFSRFAVIISILIQSIWPIAFMSEQILPNTISASFSLMRIFLFTFLCQCGTFAWNPNGFDSSVNKVVDRIERARNFIWDIDDPFFRVFLYHQDWNWQCKYNKRFFFMLCWYKNVKMYKQFYVTRWVVVLLGILQTRISGNFCCWQIRTTEEVRNGMRIEWIGQNGNYLLMQ